MPLVEYFRGIRILKAKRSKRLAGRPAWQTQDPGSKAGRDAYKIAAKFQSTFSRTFLEAVRNLVTPEVERAIRKAWKSGSPAAVLGAIPYFAQEPDAKVWENFTDRLSVAYLSVIQAAGDDAAKEMNKSFDTDLKFYALPPEAPPANEVISKSMEDVRRAASGMTVEVNPYSIKWVKDRGLELVEQTISKQQQKVVADIIQRSMEVGVRPTEAIDSIRANIGLTERDYLATVKRKRLHLEAGLSEEQAETLTEKYRKVLLTKRAERIARTETIAAQAQGRQATWQIAQDSGQLPAVRRRWMTPPASPNPNSPCDICLELDGKTALLGEPYDSAIAGMILGPPAHPNCGCTEVLERIPPT